MDNFEHGFAVTDTSAKPPRFVVGIGASAGGLESLEKFFRNLPTDTDLAYQRIQLQPLSCPLLAQAMDQFNMRSY